MIIFYKLFLLIYSAGIHVVSLWNKKAKLWIDGRKNFFEDLNKEYAAGKKNVWMHCASLGEFEQGRPVLKKILESYPEVSIVITFFSPSGYEIAKKDKDFTQVYYLPIDSGKNAKQLINTLKPDLIIWIKYEYWHYYLNEIKQQNIPLLLVSGVYANSQVFFKWYGKFYRNMLESFTHFFVQNHSSKEALQNLIPAAKITVSGDTRCDRVINIAENFTEVDDIAEFCGSCDVIVAGSTWEDDEAEWIHFVKIHPEIKFIIAPHEIDAENLADVKKKFHGSVFYSEWKEKKVSGFGNQVLGDAHNCMIIDNIGTLSRLYKYATITYVGGGFGYNGLHNILEAAVYGKPVIFGPEYEKNFEAEDLIDCKGAVSIENALELEKVVNNLLNNKAEIISRGIASKKYVIKMQELQKRLLSIFRRIAFLLTDQIALQLDQFQASRF